MGFPSDVVHRVGEVVRSLFPATTGGGCLFLTLPTELVALVLGHLSLDDLVSCAQTCLTLEAVALSLLASEAFWKALFSRPGLPFCHWEWSVTGDCFACRSLGLWRRVCGRRAVPLSPEVAAFLWSGDHPSVRLPEACLLRAWPNTSCLYHRGGGGTRFCFSSFAAGGGYLLWRRSDCLSCQLVRDWHWSFYSLREEVSCSSSSSCERPFGSVLSLRGEWVLEPQSLSSLCLGTCLCVYRGCDSKWCRKRVRLVGTIVTDV
jgi:hypothetical protein